MRVTRLLALASFTLLAAVVIAHAAGTGNLKLDVLGEDRAGARNPAHVIAADGREAGQVTAARRARGRCRGRGRDFVGDRTMPCL
jgi:hypothetical protein